MFRFKKITRDGALYSASKRVGLPQTQLGGEAHKATVNDFSCHIQLTSDLFYNIKMYFLKISTFQKSYFVVSM